MTIADLKNEIQKLPEYKNLNPEDYMLLIEGDFSKKYVKKLGFFIRRGSKKESKTQRSQMG